MKNKRKPGGQPKQICKHGHNKDITGRTADGACKLCKAGLDKARRDRVRNGEQIVVPKSQFCKRGHDTFITGRYNNGGCIACRKQTFLESYVPSPVVKKEFCLNGHEIAVVGRTDSNNCKACKIDYDEQYHKKEEVRERVNKRYKERRETDLQYKLTVYLRSRLNSAIRDNAKVGSSIKDLGCSIDFLKDYIAAKFHDGMTWDNWGDVWELDHIAPLWKFDLTDREQFLNACNYTNLQPLTIVDHLQKTIQDIKGCKKKKNKS